MPARAAPRPRQERDLAPGRAWRRSGATSGEQCRQSRLQPHVRGAVRHHRRFQPAPAEHPAEDGAGDPVPQQHVGDDGRRERDPGERHRWKMESAEDQRRGDVRRPERLARAEAQRERDHRGEHAPPDQGLLDDATVERAARAHPEAGGHGTPERLGQRGPQHQGQGNDDDGGDAAHRGRLDRDAPERLRPIAPLGEGAEPRGVETGARREANSAPCRERAEKERLQPLDREDGERRCRRSRCPDRGEQERRAEGDTPRRRARRAARRAGSRRRRPEDGVLADDARHAGPGQLRAEQRRQQLGGPRHGLVLAGAQREADFARTAGGESVDARPQIDPHRLLSFALAQDGGPARRGELGEPLRGVRSALRELDSVLDATDDPVERFPAGLQPVAGEQPEALWQVRAHAPRDLRRVLRAEQLEVEILGAALGADRAAPARSSPWAWDGSPASGGWTAARAGRCARARSSSRGG